MPSRPSTKTPAPKAKPDVGEVERLARKLLDTVFSGAEYAVEPDGQAGWSMPPSGYKGLVFTLKSASNWSTLGIAHGADLADPDRLMEGAGKVHKHVKLRTPADVASPKLRRLLKRALTAAHERTGH